MALGKRIKHYREGRGLTLEQLSDLAAVEIGTISALENRDSQRSKYAAPLAKALGLTVEQLLDNDHDYLKESLPYLSTPPAKPLIATEVLSVVGRLSTRETDVILAWRAISQRDRDRFYAELMKAHEDANQFAAEVLARRGAHGVVDDKRAASTLPEHPDGEQPDSVPGAFK